MSDFSFSLYIYYIIVHPTWTSKAKVKWINSKDAQSHQYKCVIIVKRTDTVIRFVNRPQATVDIITRRWKLRPELACLVHSAVAVAVMMIINIVLLYYSCDQSGCREFWSRHWDDKVITLGFSAHNHGNSFLIAAKLPIQIMIIIIGGYKTNK